MNKDTVFLAYCNFGGLADVTEDQAKKLTHLDIAFGIVKDDLIDISNIRSKRFYLDQIREYNPNLIISLSTGGGGGKGHGPATKPEKIEAFVKSTMDAVRELELDGIDCDWEFPCDTGDKAEKQQHVELMRRYREELDIYEKERGKKCWLTIAAASWDRYFENTDVLAVEPYLDFINLMTYDICDISWPGKHTGHHSNLYSSEYATYPYSIDWCVKKLCAMGLPKEKIVIGAAFYSRRWNGLPNEKNGFDIETDVPCIYGPGYTEINLIYEKSTEWIKYWDDTAKAPWLFNGRSMITYDDPQSMKCKAEYVKETGVRGIMYWAHDYDKTGLLFNAIYDNLFL